MEHHSFFPDRLFLSNQRTQTSLTLITGQPLAWNIKARFSRQALFLEPENSNFINFNYGTSIGLEQQGLFPDRLFS
jgi:hypothetical protein